jgi:hypothetical protein
MEFIYTRHPQIASRVYRQTVHFLENNLLHVSTSATLLHIQRSLVFMFKTTPPPPFEMYLMLTYIKKVILALIL